MARSTLEQLYALTVPEIRDIFLETMQGIVDQAVISEMVKAIEENDAEALFRASGFTPATLGPILDRIEEAYNAGADYEVSGWPKRLRTPTGLVIFQFNVRNPRVEEDLKKFSSAWVTRITEEMRENVRYSLEQRMIKGDNPRTTALDIVGRINPSTRKREGGIIGLAENQLKWVTNTERYLKQLDNKYFTLTLRDKRFDSTVREAIKSNRPLSASTIEKLTISYKSRALKYRGDVIARTETLSALSRGRNASYLQAIDEGTLTKTQISKEWDDTGDSRERHTHVALGRKYDKGKGIDFDEPFVSPSGARLMFPGDTSLGADAKETVQCRCMAKYRVNFFEGVNDD